jgi:hypothetical protein
VKRLKRRWFSGCVCEQVVFSVPDNTREIKRAKPRPRFHNEEERAAHRIKMARQQHARVFNENFGPTSLYSTLTLSNEYEVHSFEEARIVRRNYVKRLQYAYPEARIAIYMGRGKSTSRIHFHMVTDGIPEEAIVEKWGMGPVHRVEHLREHNFYDGVDHGQDYTGLANYLFDHWTPEQGGHYWKGTRNLKKPEPEPCTVALANYSEKRPPIAPKGYILVEVKQTKYGYLYFKYIRKPEESFDDYRKRKRKEQRKSNGAH